MKTRMSVRRPSTLALMVTALALTLGAGGAGLGTAAASEGVTAVTSEGITAAAAKPKFQMPFLCNTKWQLNTYDSGHNPALDIVVKGNTGSSGKWVLPGYKGTVAKTFWDRGAGNVIIIKHGGGWFTAYYHLKDKHNKYVHAGENVGPRTKIGRIGATGNNSGDWAHLHYEQRYKASGIPTEANRKPVHFNGTKYTGTGRTWTSVTSKNC